MKRKLTPQEKLSIEDAMKFALLGAVLIVFMNEATPLLSRDAKAMAGGGEVSETLVTAISAGMAFALFVMTFISVRIIIRIVYGRFG